MRALTVLGVVLARLLLGSAPALAWDPFAGDPSTDAPVDPAPLVVPDGLYLVTDVYAGDVVSTSGATTTYTTTTDRETPGTYARIIDVVGTGQPSPYDGASLNGRARLPDGRLVAGTYYEDFVLTPSGYVSVNIVFFQDDSITTSSSTPSPATATPVARATAPAATPAPTPVTPRATPGPVTATPVPVVATAGVSLGVTAPVLAHVEVLRGRRVSLWPRAFLNGTSVPVRSWRLLSGGGDIVSSRAGDGAVACEITWLTLPPADSTWTLRFEVTSDAIPGRVLYATIDVAVRSPALLQ